MSNSIVFDLEHNRKRLQYYSQLKQKAAPSKKPTTIDKWVEIYEERVSKLERKVTKLGLKTQLQASQQGAGARSA